MKYLFPTPKQREVLAYSQTVMLKTMKCPVRIVWVYRQARHVALMTTDLTRSAEQIGAYCPPGHTGITLSQRVTKFNFQLTLEENMIFSSRT